MIEVTRLDGEKVFINERNIQWIERLPDTAITFLGGARLLVREKAEALVTRLEGRSSGASAAPGECAPRPDHTDLVSRSEA